MSTGRRKLLLACGFETGLLALAFLIFAAGKDQYAVRARRVITLLMITESLVLALAPVFAVRKAAGRSVLESLLMTLRPVGWTLAVTLAGPLVLALVFDRGALPGWIMAKLICAAIGMASAGLVLFITRLTGRPALSLPLSLVLILGFSLQPFYTMPVIRALRGKPEAQKLLIDSGVRAPWMAASHAMLSAGPAGWKYMPVTSPYLYEHWVGTDYPVNVPGNGSYLIEYLVFGLLLAGLAALFPRKTAPREVAPTVDN